MIMKTLIFRSLTCAALMFSAIPLMAQDSVEMEAYHPFLTDKFNIGLGIFSPQKSFELQVDGSDPGANVDFDETLRVDDSETTGSIDFRWRFGEKWSLWAQYWKVDSKGGAILTDDLEWQDLVFKEGTFANAGVDLTVTRLFFGRELWTGPKYEFGAGIGFHWLEIGAFIEGEIILEDGGTGFERGSVEAGFPMPNLGLWYMYSWSPKWVAIARGDWLDVDVGDYSGSLWSAMVGVNYQPFEHVGFGLSYNNFVLDGDVRKNDWHGGVEVRQHGPRLALTATW